MKYELHEIDKQILKVKEQRKNELKKLQNLKKTAEKKEVEIASSELLKIAFGNNWLEIYRKIKSDPTCKIEVLINGNSINTQDII